jgi:hypothetical protein
VDKPITIVVEDDGDNRWAFEGPLNNRFGHDYEVVPELADAACSDPERFARVGRGGSSAVPAAWRAGRS